MPEQTTLPTGIDPTVGEPTQRSLGRVYVLVMIVSILAGVALARFEGQAEGQAWLRYLPFALMVFAGLWATVNGTVAYGAIAGGVAGGVLMLAGSVARGLFRDLAVEETLRTGLAGTLLATTVGLVLGTVGGIPVRIARMASHSGSTAAKKVSGGN